MENLQRSGGLRVKFILLDVYAIGSLLLRTLLRGSSGRRENEARLKREWENPRAFQAVRRETS